MLQKWSFNDEFTGGGGGFAPRSPSPVSRGVEGRGDEGQRGERPGEAARHPLPSLLSSISSNQAIDPANFIQIGLASSDEIQNWAERSYFIGQQFVEIGEVKRPDTLNYRTFKPEKDGLFCERIFGPVNDWTCACGQLKEQRFAMDHERALLGKLKPKVCSNCQVEVTSSRLRRYRMGYISLACPVTHIWYLNSRPSLFSILLKMPTKYIKKIAYYKAYSPSSLKREYMSSCLGPGGDFFDNEWEFLHFWLSGKHSVEDIPSRMTLFLQANKEESSNEKGTGGLRGHSPAGAQPPASFAPSLHKSEKTFLTKITKETTAFDEQYFSELNGIELISAMGGRSPGLRPSPPSAFLGLRDKVPTTQVQSGRLNTLFTKQTRKGLRPPTESPPPVFQVKNPPVPSGSASSVQGAGASSPPQGSEISGSRDKVPATQGVFPGTVSTTTVKLVKVQKQNHFDQSELKGLRSALYNKMPESPEWLSNTGAQALLNHLKSRDWQKETEKLEFEFQATPSLNLNDERFDFGIPDEETTSEIDFPSQTTLVEEMAGGAASPPEGTGGLRPAKPPRSLQETPAPVNFTEKNFSNSLLSKFSEKESDFLLKRRKSRVRTLKLLKSFQKSGLPFTGMIFHTLPVLPPELRPIIQLGAGQLASSDVNDLYRRILSRNNRLKYYLYETHFVEFLVRSEQQLVQLAVDALLENGKTTSVRHTSGQKRLYKSLSDRIGGKQGRFRMNLLGKRVDYSGRSVIVVGPRLKLFQCGLPYEMAIELFQPFLLRHMLELQLAKTIRAAKNILRFNKPLARQLLHHVVQAHPILLNRAPTLHRLGIQAFQPVLVFGRAIHLHPLVCPAFNADFDGDQMAVHIPLSPQARIEARLLMLASGNWLSSSTGQPNVLPSQDMVLGFYYLTLEKYAYQKGRGLFFQSLGDVMQAYEIGSIDLHSQIWLKWYGPFTGDSNSRLTNPQKHIEGAGQFYPRQVEATGLRRLQAKPVFQSIVSVGQSSVNSQKSNEKHLQNSITRFRRDTDQPLEIRLNTNGISTKIYSSYQWQQDSKGRKQVLYIRTTPGRVLMNQIFQKFS